MTIEERVEVLERQVRGLGGKTETVEHPYIGKYFWMKCGLGPWEMWKACMNGIGYLDNDTSQTFHTWEVFDRNVDSRDWRWVGMEIGIDRGY